MWLTRLLLYAILTAFPASATLSLLTPSPSPTSRWPYRLATHHQHGHPSPHPAGIRPSIASLTFISTFAANRNGMLRRYNGDIGRLLAEQVNVGLDLDKASSDASTGAVMMGEEDDEYVDRGLRFGGVGRLYASKDATITPDIVLDRLSSATVAVVGLGGVGSWTAESLCRSGIGNLILIDLDDICISNTNRQLHATSSAVGKMKISQMKERLLDINPRCNVTLIHDFVTVDNADALLQQMMGPNNDALSACIDAIDGMHEKTALILACVRRGVPIVTCGGAAGRIDPTRIVVDDLTKVQEDRLLFRCRKLLRQGFGFPKVPVPTSRGKKPRVRRWRIPAVYSTEVQQKTPSAATAAAAAAAETTSSFRTCDGALGTACFVTGTFGFLAACKVVEMIALDEYVVPKKQGNSR
eukprot:CAMPEP_0183713558 /NCGR_PEP_ID=MMETSP0737-20130205/8368_1 /TAXON_ID=385413 /ORGANISM="Thalassiosira miniscula, Strain CCMP1093" /LENGTH=411 /DNA_ID=CAMNT_0025942357 /DNA_START=100 /DNA_END=1335 /DNA_ORIENTATION=+